MKVTEAPADFCATGAAMDMGNGAASVFGDAATYAPAGAALLNGALGHALDFDDTHAAGDIAPRHAGHPGSDRRWL